MKKCKIAKSHGVSQELSQSQQSPCQVLTSSRWKLATWSRFSHTPLVWQTWNSLRLRAPSLVRLDLYHRKVVENPYLNQTKAILLTTKWYCHAIWFGDRSWERAQPWPDTGVCNSQRLTRTRRMLKYCAGAGSSNTSKLSKGAFFWIFWPIRYPSSNFHQNHPLIQHAEELAPRGLNAPHGSSAHRCHSLKFWFDVGFWWVVFVYQFSNSGKPLYFLKDTITLKNGDVMRLVWVDLGMYSYGVLLISISSCRRAICFFRLSAREVPKDGNQKWLVAVVFSQFYIMTYE